MMRDEACAMYLPINTLKSVAHNVWIVDGPVIRFGMPWPKFPFPTRMTVVRLANNELFVHSPTPLTPSLREEIHRMGKVRFIIGPTASIIGGFLTGRRAFPALQSISRRASRSRRGDTSLSKIFRLRPYRATRGMPKSPHCQSRAAT